MPPSAASRWRSCWWWVARSTSARTPTTRTPRSWPGSPTGGRCAPATSSLTRGDGGQNLIGTEQGDELGVIRTQELLAARRIDGAEQFFTRALDFGYSKTPDETLAHLGPGRGARRRRVGDPHLPARRDHHALSGQRRRRPRAPHRLGDPGRARRSGRGRPAALPRAARAREALAGEADAVERLAPARRGTPATAPSQLSVDLGAYDPLLGRVLHRDRGASRSMHKSQGFGASPSARGASRTTSSWSPESRSAGTSSTGST